MYFELAFYEELNVIKTYHAFRGYAISHKVKLVKKKDPIGQLEGGKSSIKDLLNDILNETKGFKYQITLKVTLKKYKITEIEFDSVYFNSAAKTVINNIFSLENVFQEIYYRIGNRINEGSCWILELIESQDLHISNYRPLSGNSYVQLPVELTSSKKGLINIKNNGQKCLLGCHLRHVNPVKVHPERITQSHKKLANNLNYGGVELPV